MIFRKFLKSPHNGLTVGGNADSRYAGLNEERAHMAIRRMLGRIPIWGWVLGWIVSLVAAVLITVAVMNATGVSGGHGGGGGHSGSDRGTQHTAGTSGHT